MTERLTVFTAVLPSYRYISEFSLCLKMFKKALPDNSSLITTEESDPHSLRDIITTHLDVISPYVLIMKEPALLIKEGTIEPMVQILKKDRSISCVLPSDMRGFRQGRNAIYYTLRGFERFIDSLYDPEDLFISYDGRDPWMFLIRGNILREMEIPEDPLSIPGVLPAKSTCISLNAYIHPFIDYFEQTRSDVLDLIPGNISSLLDVGCARGRFGIHAKNKFSCKVVGVEINPYEAAKAREHFDYVYCGDMLTTEINERFDCITCLDVLEHLHDPEAFLQKMHSLLHDDGYIVLSVPNVGHWSVVEDLLAGRWDYIPPGILCVAHLRFFTKTTIQNLLKDTGFRIISIKEQKNPILDSMLDNFNLLKQAGMEIDEQSLACFCYYIVAKKII